MFRRITSKMTSNRESKSSNINYLQRGEKKHELGTKNVPKTFRTEATRVSVGVTGIAATLAEPEKPSESEILTRIRSWWRKRKTSCFSSMATTAFQKNVREIAPL